MKRLIVPGIVLCGILLAGCGRISATDGPADYVIPDAAPEIEAAPDSFPAGDPSDPYRNVVTYYQEQSDLVTDEVRAQYSYQNQYALYDLDKDGSLELLVKIGYCEADYQYTVWTLDGEGAPLQVEGTVSGSHTGLYGAAQETGFYSNSCHMGSQNIRKYDITEGNTLEMSDYYSGVLSGETENLYGYYDLTCTDGFFRLEERPIGAYVYEESQHILDGSEPMTLDAYLAGLEAIREAEGEGAG